MPHHDTDAECNERRNGRPRFNIATVTTVVGSGIAILVLLGTIFGFIVRTDNKADNADKKAEAVGARVEKMDVKMDRMGSKIDRLIGVVEKRLPD
jgi:hypothetical protein